MTSHSRAAARCALSIGIGIAALAISTPVLAQTSPFLTGATALQSNILAWLTPVAIILVMVLGGMAMANRISWGWCIAALMGIAISFGAPQIVTWVRGMFGVWMSMSERNLGLRTDPRFVGAARPPMRWGVTYSGLLVNGVFTLEAFLLTKNLLTLALALPIHGICALLCARDPRFFDLVLLWGRTRIPALLANSRLWKA